MRKGRRAACFNWLMWINRINFISICDLFCNNLGWNSSPIITDGSASTPVCIQYIRNSDGGYVKCISEKEIISEAFLIFLQTLFMWLAKTKCLTYPVKHLPGDFRCMLLPPFSLFPRSDGEKFFYRQKSFSTASKIFSSTLKEQFASFLVLGRQTLTLWGCEQPQCNFILRYLLWERFSFSHKIMQFLTYEDDCLQQMQRDLKKWHLSLL